MDSLLEQRFGPAAPNSRPAVPRTPPVAEPTPGRHQAAGLSMSSAEFIALLHLSPEQADSLLTLVRQTRITITRD